ncbi:hypothetical protein RN001_000211 [Aquatica leii]|uniref:Uncharacterized protein n=1 Tax=Aquatica leii TaxID=1421715 RepID=A0AAN7Q9G8_9COLE|nr:hypothetical protein RN001_000211 [Aquatica leii]
MFKQICVVLTDFVLVTCLALFYLSHQTYAHQTLADYLGNRCPPNVSTKELEAKAMQMYSCAMTLKNIKNPTEYYTFYCENDFIDQCTNIIVSMFIYCYYPEEQYLSELILHTYKATKAQACQKTKEEFLELYQDLKNLECVQNDNVTHITMKCINSLSENDDFSNLILTKSLVCRKFPELQDCIEEDFALNCESSLLMDIVKHTFSSILDWCALN